MTAQRHIECPQESELPGLSQELLTEVAAVLATDRWVLLRTASTTNRKIHSAAILRHVCSLLEDVAEAVERGREAALRVLGRAHLEAWLIGMYIAFGGDEALVDIASGYRRGIEIQQNQLNAYNDALRLEIQAARKSNVKIQAQNAGIAIWNNNHPEAHKQMVDMVPMPTRTSVTLDLVGALGDPATGEDQISPLALAAVVARLKVLCGTDEGGDAGFDMAYDLAYRGLSNLGAHPTLWVINQYLHMNEHGLGVRTSKTMHAESLAAPIFNTAVMQTALLAQQVLRMQDAGTPVADSILDRYRPVAPAANHVSGAEGDE